MRRWSFQWMAVFNRQLRRHDLDPDLWFLHFGVFGILPEDANAVCENCADRHIPPCMDGLIGSPFICMKRGGPKTMLPLDLEDDEDLENAEGT